jgi:hypothetical protein
VTVSQYKGSVSLSDQALARRRGEELAQIRLRDR